MTVARVDKPVRQEQSVVVDLRGGADEVFALMCPVREHDWIEDWRTNAIWSNSGLVEDGCVFTTPLPSEAEDEPADEAVWIATRHDAGARQLELVKLVPKQTVTRLRIAVSPTESGSALSVSYELTALSQAGREAVARHTAEGLQSRIRQYWKPAIERELRPH